MMDRYPYDLSHYSLITGQMGRLQTVACIPVVAGDSFDVNVEGLLRLSPLRRPLVVDVRVDHFAFYVPHRHVYGDDWITFMKEGWNEGVTFSGINTALAGGRTCHLFGTTASGVVPEWQVVGYNQIYNRYFIHPTVTAEIAENNVPSDNATRAYGRVAPHLKTLHTTGVGNKITAADHEVDVDTGAGTFDLLDLTLMQGRYKTEVERQWFAQRYNDVLDQAFGTTVNIDADQRPELVMSHPVWLSGVDIDGTADANFGQYVGKASGVVGIKFPRKFFPEHGTLWIMALLRWPPIFRDALHYLMTPDRANFTYADMSGDPSLVEAKAPIEMLAKDLYDTGATTSMGVFPYAQWYRTHPHYMHDDFWAVDSGFPTLQTPANQSASLYADPAQGWSAAFSSTSLGHWYSQYRVGVGVHRVVPGPKSSMYAGT